MSLPMSTGRNETKSRLAAVAAVIERDWANSDAQVKTLVADLRRSDERTRFALGVARAGVWEADCVPSRSPLSAPRPRRYLGYPARARWLHRAGLLEAHTHPEDVDRCRVAAPGRHAAGYDAFRVPHGGPAGRADLSGCTMSSPSRSSLTGPIRLRSYALTSP